MKMIQRRVGFAWLLWAAVVASLVGGCASSRQVRTQADDHYRLAQSYLSNESPLLAEQEIRKALTLRPDDARYLECLALIHQTQVYQAQGTLNLTRLQLAEEAYRAALRQADAPPSVLYMRRLILHHFYRASIRNACIHMLSTGCGEKNDAKLTAVCIRGDPSVSSSRRWPVPSGRTVHCRMYNRCNPEWAGKPLSTIVTTKRSRSRI